MKPVVALSTCWCSHRHTDGLAMCEEMAALGFEYVELSHGIRMSLVPGILDALQRGVVKISTTHNFCPLPAGVMHPAPNLYHPSSPDSRERKQWVRNTTRSLEFAKQVGARLVVAHMGNLFFFWGDPSGRVEALAEERSPEERLEDPTYARALAKLFAKLRKATPKHVRRIRECLEQVAGTAKEAGLKLGIENREALTELPLDEGMESFLVQMDDLGITGGWHDCGHARLKEQMGILRHAEYLEKNHARLLGFHLHDVSAEGKDHQPLGTGTVDFAMIRRYIRPEHVLVLELSPRLDTAQVEASRDYLWNLLDKPAR